MREPLKRLPGRGSTPWGAHRRNGRLAAGHGQHGTRPTVQDDGITETAEVHLLEGGRQCYDETMELRLWPACEMK